MQAKAGVLTAILAAVVLAGGAGLPSARAQFVGGPPVIDAGQGSNAIVVRFDNGSVQVLVDGDTVLEGAAGDLPSITINGQDGSDTLVVEGNPAGSAVPITFNGGNGDDMLRVVNPNGTILATRIDYGGGPGTDGMELNGEGAGFTQTHSVGPDNGAGTIVLLDGNAKQTIIYSGLEPIYDTVPSAVLTILATDGPNTIDVTDGPAIGGIQVQIDTFESIEFKNKTQVDIRAGDWTAGGDTGDTINLNYTVDTTGLATLNVYAEEGDDQINVQAALSGAVTLYGNEGNDTFHVQPSPTIAIAVDGGSPSSGDPGVPPGDTLGYDAAGVSGLDLIPGATPDDGTLAAGNRQPVTYTSIETLTGVFVDPAVSVTESVDPVTAGSGPGNLTYVVTVQNAGPSDASGVTVSLSLTLPAGVSIASITPSTGSYSAPDWTPGDLSAGADETLTVVLTAGASAEQQDDSILIQAMVETVSEIDVEPGNDSVSESTSVRTEADLEVTKSGPGRALNGSSIRYEVTVFNRGPSDALDVEINDAPPAGVEPAAFAPVSVGTLAAGSSTTVQYDVTVGRMTLGVITNVGWAATTTTDPNSGNDTAGFLTLIEDGLSETDEPGSLLVFPLIDNKNHRTMIEIANHGGDSVWLQGIMVLRTATGEFLKNNFQIHLTAGEPFWWETRLPYDRKDVDGTRTQIRGFDGLQGFCFLWAVDSPTSQLEKEWNFLTGSALLLGGGGALHYRAYPHQALDVEGDRVLRLDGWEYTRAPSRIMTAGFAANAVQGLGGKLAVCNLEIDFILSTQPEFGVNVWVWNQDEVRTSNHLNVKQFALFDLQTDLQLDISAVFTPKWQLTADGSRALWAALYQKCDLPRWGGHIWHDRYSGTDTVIVLP